MVSISPRMGFKVWDGTDPFKRQDFLDNFAQIEASPGDFICTSVTLPTWAVGQAGRRAFLTDQNRWLIWSGTVWVEPQSATNSWTAGAILNQNLSPGAVGIYTLQVIPMVRPGWVTSMIFAEVSSSAVQHCTGQGGLNGTYGQQSVVHWGVASQVDERQMTTLASVYYSTPAPVTVTAKFTIGAEPGTVGIYKLAAFTLISLQG